MEHLEVDLPATEASEEEVERNNVEEDVAGDKVERGVKSVKPIGAEIWAGKVLELVLEVASRQIRLAPAWVWHELCKIFDNKSSSYVTGVAREIRGRLQPRETPNQTQPYLT